MGIPISGIAALGCRGVSGAYTLPVTRGNNFDALRLLAALTVLISHQFTLTGYGQTEVAGTYLMGTVALFVFFAISGYLVAGSWQSDPNFGRYLIRRMLRMGPGFLGLSLLTEYGLTAFGITSFPDNPVSAVNGSLWTLPYEIVCYLVLAGLALVFPVRAAAMMTLAILLLLWRFGFEMAGCELAMMFCVGVILRHLPMRRPAVLLGGAIVAAYIAKNQPFAILLLTVPIASVLFGIASWPVVRSAGRFGDFSYGIYIYGFPVQQLGILILGVETPFWILISTSLLVTAMLAVLSWHFVESPGLKLKNHLSLTAQPPPHNLPCGLAPSERR